MITDTVGRLWVERAQRVIPGGTQTLSKAQDQWPAGLTPRFIQSASGAYVTDVDGTQWLDWTMALGPQILGYSHPAVNAAVAAQLPNGVVFPFSHPLEVEVAERICVMCPHVEMVRFGKTGSDAVAAAVKCSQRFTGRERVVFDGGYHGWHYRDQRGKRGDIWNLDKSVAAVVIEPDRFFDEPPLRELRRLTRSLGILLVFDEVITGFRMAPGGAAEAYGVHPDLSVYGKALANGLPLSAVGGRRDVMEQMTFWSGTHGGETLSLAAAKATLDLLADGSLLEEMSERGRWIHNEIHQLDGYPSHLQWYYSRPKDKTWHQQVMAEEGILYNGHLFLSAAHSDRDVLRTIKAFRRIVHDRPHLRSPVVSLGVR